MSPERVNGEPAIPASDLWALGATLYAATEGRAPHHRGDPMAVLAAVMTQDVPPPKNAGPLAPVLTGLLERDPVRRLSGDRAEEALQAVASGHAVHMANVQIASNEATAVDGPAGSDVPPAPAPAPVPVPVPPDMTTQYPPGTGQQWTPTHAPASSRKRSSVVPVLAGAAVAAVILGVAGFVFWPEGSSSAGGPGTGTGTAQSPPVQQTSPTTPATTPPATPTSTPGGTVAPLPPGFVRGTGPGYTIGVPRGWRRSVQGNSVVWTDPASSAYVQVDQTVWSGDPYEHWVTWEQEARADGKLKDFQRIGRSPARPSPDGGGRHRVHLDPRDGRHARPRPRRHRRWRPYAVVVAVPASQWNGNEALVKNVLDTFRPSGVG